jgi:predicted flap endonuclease-1-like 5' DNA nuclease
VGLLWELFNVRARGKWIYTVPGFEDLKLFEMPVAGFLGFPPFALECFALWQALVLAGVAVPGRAPGGGRSSPERPDVRRVAAVRRDAVPRGRAGARRGAVVGAALAVAAAAAWGMEARTITSRTPRLAELPRVPAAELARAGHDVFSVARARPEDLAALTGRSPREADDWVRAARLAALRGIGTANALALQAVGIASVEDLARAAPDSLAARLRGLVRSPVPPARVRVWVRAAAGEAGARSPREDAAPPPPREDAGRSTVSFPHPDR